MATKKPWPQSYRTVGTVSLQSITGIFWAWKAPSAALELHSNAGSPLHRQVGSCCALPPLHLPTYGMVHRKGSMARTSHYDPFIWLWGTGGPVENQQASHKESGISLLELLCFSAKAVAFHPPPFFISICFCSPISHIDKGKMLHFWSAQLFRYEIHHEIVY